MAGAIHVRVREGSSFQAHNHDTQEWATGSYWKALRNNFMIPWPPKEQKNGKCLLTDCTLVLRLSRWWRSSREVVTAFTQAAKLNIKEKKDSLKGSKYFYVKAMNFLSSWWFGHLGFFQLSADLYINSQLRTNQKEIWFNKYYCGHPYKVKRIESFNCNWYTMLSIILYYSHQKQNCFIHENRYTYVACPNSFKS